MTLTYMLDTTLCIRVPRDRPAGLLPRFNQEAGRLCLSTIVLTEPLHGATRSALPDAGRQAVEAMAERLDVVAFDVNAAAHAADIRADLERRGVPIGGYDVLIAGHARSLGLIVVTGNLGAFQCRERMSCPRFEAGLLSAKFVVCSGDHACFGAVFCGRRT